MPEVKHAVFGHPTTPKDTIESLQAKVGVLERSLAAVTVERDALLNEKQQPDAQPVEPEEGQEEQELEASDEE